jgi:methylated-DNA-[protein]-cysteine S-methyltransferase
MREARKKIKCGLVRTELGWVGVAGSPDKLVSVTLPKATVLETLENLQEGLEVGIVREDAVFDGVLDALRRFCAGEPHPLDFPVDLSSGTPFQRRVWETVSAIPYGQTMTYGQVAWEVGCPKGARAVGQAMGKNPVPLVVPCHRVVGSNGGLGGFGGGLDLKRRLLDMEKQ